MIMERKFLGDKNRLVIFVDSDDFTIETEKCICLRSFSDNEYRS